MSYDPRKAGALCDECPLFRTCSVTPTPTGTLKPSKLAIIGGSPGSTEREVGKYFIGPIGQRIRALLRGLGINPLDIHWNNVLQCEVPDGLAKAEFVAAAEACRPRLERELRRIEPRLLLSLGDEALLGLTGYKEPVEERSGHIYDTLVGQPSMFTVWPVSGNTEVFTRHVRRAVGALDDDQWQWPRIVIGDGPDNRVAQTLENIYNDAWGGFVGFDVETMGTSAWDPLTAVAFATKDYAVSYLWPPEQWYGHEEAKEIVSLTEQIIESPNIGLAGHNVCHDLGTISQNGFTPRGEVIDTLVAHRILHAQTSKHTLGFVTAQYTALPNWKADFRAVGDEGSKRYKSVMKTHEGRVDLMTYNARDAWAEVPIWTEMRRELSERKMLSQYETKMALLEMGFAAEMRGFAVDKARVKSIKDPLQTKIEEVEEALQDHASAAGWPETKEFNPNSNHHIRDLLLHYMGAPVLKKTESGHASTDKSTRSLYAKMPQFAPLMRELDKHAELTKITSTYLDGLQIRASGCVHAHMDPAKAVTGRSSYSPNLQNVPKKLRQVYCSRPGNYIVSADASQLELRIAAAISGDPLLLEWFDKGVDPHSAVQASLGLQDVPKGRTFAKNFEYQIIYGGTALDIYYKVRQHSPDVRLTDIEHLYDAFKIQHSRLIYWQKEHIKKARRNDKVICPLSGRVIRFFGEFETPKALNYPIQGTAADLIDRALLRIRDLLPRAHFFLAQVHDDIVLEGPNPVKLAEVLEDGMHQTLTLEGGTVDLPIEFLVCAPDDNGLAHWGQGEEYKTLDEVRELFGEEA